MPAETVRTGAAPAADGRRSADDAPAGPAAGTHPGRVVAVLAVAAVAVLILFLTLGALDALDLILPLRAGRVAAMVVVGVAIAVSTVLFQTVTENRILTPAIMGFDSLYALIQTAAVFFLGATTVNGLAPTGRFAVEVAAMLVFSTALFRWIFGGPRRSLHLVVLVGIVFGVLFRSLATFLQRVIDPNEYLTVADRLFASFSAPDPTLLLVCTAVVALVCAWAWTRRRDLDVLALGRAHAVALGVDHRRLTMAVLLVSALLVSVSTALVGPITFFGLLVANLAYQVAGTHRHAYVLPVAALLAVITLVGGQAVLEHVFGLDTVLSVVIEFLGGLVFIVLLVRGGTR
ncbi:iron chelate uptake ABC transporter family permease subunit [Georgenia sp. TF02-10]|uniref:iron chelate uptake ABC transporter family permease subunit n=1 Tax=Georgenia sp. TF02-10 TaxID=2917725 RepID=UPI001FA7D164|nr:iron chelate uptake ABC transporter family permease subunit [Georgenia sp. TF02-10]UNX53359.1 iron chelate uptake ABC transporter family permease subunit [Georgenia sp. TF02-10]